MTDTAAPRFTETAHEKQVALSRALSFINDPQFIEGDRILARCYMNAIAELAALPTREELIATITSVPILNGNVWIGTYAQRIADTLIAAGVKVRHE